MKPLRPHQQAALDLLRRSIGTGDVRLDGETWSQYRGSRYWVSDQARVYSTIRAGRLLKQTLTPQGYPYVSLMIGDVPVKTTVHRMVAELFVPGAGMTVNHKDGDKTNNLPRNLEWCSFSENNAHARDHGLVRNFGSDHYAAKLNEATVKAVREMVASGFLHREAAVAFGITRKHVTKIVSGGAWRRA
jgi:hypothetical protein